MNRLLVAVAAVSLTVLTACGPSAPPARELANEMIDTLDVSQAVKDCMHAEVEAFQVDPDAGFESFDDVAEKAADDQPQAVAIMAEFEEALGECRNP